MATRRRCCLCLNTNVYADFRIEKVNFPFCSMEHFQIYMNAKDIKDAEPSQKCNYLYCINVITRVNVRIYCDCGFKHLYCTTTCKQKDKDLRDDYIDGKKKTYDNKLARCQTCLCGSIDINSGCVNGHNSRCIGCSFLDRCRKCESQTWYQKLLLYVYINTTWNTYEKEIQIDGRITCNYCKSIGPLYLIQPGNFKYCRNCAYKTHTMTPKSNLLLSYVGRR